MGPNRTSAYNYNNMISIIRRNETIKVSCWLKLWGKSKEKE